MHAIAWPCQSSGPLFPLFNTRFRETICENSRNSPQYKPWETFDIFSRCFTPRKVRMSHRAILEAIEPRPPRDYRGRHGRRRIPAMIRPNPTGTIVVLDRRPIAPSGAVLVRCAPNG